MADMDDVVDLTDKQGPIACKVAGIKIVLRRIQRADLPEIHRLMLAVPWTTTLEDVEDCFAVRQDCQFGAFLLDEPSKLICKFVLNMRYDLFGGRHKKTKSCSDVAVTHYYIDVQLSLSLRQLIAQ